MPSKRGRAGRGTSSSTPLDARKSLKKSLSARVCGKAHSQLPAVTPSRLLEEAIAHGPEGAGGASSLRPSSISLVENVTRSTRPSQTHASRHHPLLANAAPINQHVRDPQDNKITKPTTTVTNFAENVQTTQDMPSHASAHASTVKSLCGWCGDDFYNDHMRTTTSCCGLAVGDSCLEELYGKDDTCRLCSETRPVKVDSSICLSSEGPIHIKRFINVPQSVSTRQDLNDEDDERYKPSTHSIGDETLHFSLQSSKTTFILDDSDDEDTEHHEPSTYTIPNETLQSSLTTFTLHDLGNEDTEPHEPSTYTTRKDTLKSPKTFSRPLSQASPEAKQIHQARTHILNLLEHFIQAWGNEGAKLRENDRRLIVGRIEKALSGESLVYAHSM